MFETIIFRNNLIDQPQEAERTFWTAKAFHGYIGKTYQIECSYETVVRFFHKQGYALKTPQPWPDKQDEQLFNQPWISGLPTSLGLKATQGPGGDGTAKAEKPELPKMVTIYA